MVWFWKLVLVVVAGTSMCAVSAAQFRAGLLSALSFQQQLGLSVVFKLLA